MTNASLGQIPWLTLGLLTNDLVDRTGTFVWCVIGRWVALSGDGAPELCDSVTRLQFGVDHSLPVVPGVRRRSISPVRVTSFTPPVPWVDLAPRGASRSPGRQGRGVAEHGATRKVPMALA